MLAHHSSISKQIPSPAFADVNLVPLPLPQHIPKLFQRASIELILLPQIRGQETVSIAHRNERSF